MLYGGSERRDRILRTLGAIEAAIDIAALQSVVEDLRAVYALKHAVFFAFGKTTEEEHTLLFTYPADWTAHYLRRRYYHIDPVISIGRQSIAAIDWKMLDRSSPTVERFFAEAEEAGVGRQGLTLPSHGPAGAQALFTITSDDTDADWRALRPDLLGDMHAIASHLHARLLSLRSLTSPPPPPLPRLSARERETLQWAAVGKTIDQTAVILGLSRSAVRSYLDSARHKLNCLSKPQTVAVALKRGLIDG